MTPGPVEIARTAWGADLPDWVARLAEECAAGSQRRAASLIGFSGSLVSQVLRRKYPGDLVAVEDAVRGALMGACVECPALGQLPTHECQDWRRKAAQFVNVNTLRVRMYRACNACPRHRKGADHDDGR